jgi:DNA-binding response OmpR family regulator
MSNRTLLLVEDDKDDVFFMRRALSKAGFECPVHVVEDGESAISYLAELAPSDDDGVSPGPTLVLLDLKLPRKNGLEVLEWIRARPGFAAVVVIVLTSSRHNKDIVAAARLGANSFLVKPPNVDQLCRLMRAVKDYWWEHDQIAAAISCNEDMP